MYSTVVSDVGTVRSNNQDSAFAGEHLIAICDGMGGHAGGDTASTHDGLGACVRRYGRCTGRTRSFAKRMQRH